MKNFVPRKQLVKDLDFTIRREAEAAGRLGDAQALNRELHTYVAYRQRYINELEELSRELARVLRIARIHVALSVEYDSDPASKMLAVIDPLLERVADLWKE